MTRAFVVLLVVSFVFGCSRGDKPATAALSGADDLTPAKARELIPEAAGSPADDLAKLSTNTPKTFRLSNGESLTWLLWTYQAEPIGAKDDPKGPKERSFRFLGETINLGAVADAVAGPKDKDGKHRKYATFIHPEYITDCTCKVDGDTATGTVTFRAEKAYEGKAEYTARKKDGSWRVEEFRIPDLNIHTVLGKDDKWSKK
jgi:hypothetical protein